MLRSRIAQFSRREALDLALIVIALAGVVAVVARFVISREGNLTWDDTEYLYGGLEMAYWARLKGTWEPLRALYYSLSVRPKPPLLHAWVTQAWLLFGSRSLLPVVVAATAVPFAMLALAVVAVAWRLYGTRAALLSLLCLAASPGLLGLGTLVMVETFLALWVLLVFYSLAVLVERPGASTALLLGTALGLALLTKLTVPLLLPGAVLYAVYAYLRRHPIDASLARVIACVILPLIVLDGPWYLRNGSSAFMHARTSSRFNVTISGVATTPRFQRLLALVDDVPGWPLFLALVAVIVWASSRRRGGLLPPEGAGRSFVKVSTSGFAFGAAFLLLPTYFETRFLLPAWPAMAIVAGVLLQEFSRGGRSWRVVATALVLAISLGRSIGELEGQTRTTTYWELGDVIQELRSEHDIKTFAILGNTADWNFFKLRLINDLRLERQARDERPGQLEVLDLAILPPDEMERKLDRIDALAMLDRGQLSEWWLRYAPLLNRGYAVIDEALRERAGQFVEVRADSHVPPRYHVYVFARRPEPTPAPAPAP